MYYYSIHSNESRYSATISTTSLAVYAFSILRALLQTAVYNKLFQFPRNLRYSENLKKILIICKLSSRPKIIYNIFGLNFEYKKGIKYILPISDILVRSVSGYVLIVPVLISYFLYLKKSGRKQNTLHITAVIDTMLNVVLFVPFGFFLPLLYKKYHHIKTVALTGFLFSLSVEIVQMFDWGSTDINDLISVSVQILLEPV